MKITKQSRLFGMPGVGPAVSSTALAFGLALSVATAPARAGDLAEIYQLALDNDATYQFARLTHQSNEVDLPLAETGFKPQVSASGTMGRTLANPTGVTTTEPAHSASLSAGIVLYDKTMKMGINQTGLSVDASLLALEKGRDDLILRVASRYFSLLSAMDQREVARVQKKAIDRQMELANERLEVGLGTKTDLFDAKARLQQATADEIKAQNLINNHRALLAEMIGGDPGDIVPLASDAPLELPVPAEVDAWVAQALEKNTDLKIQEINLEVARIEIDKKKITRNPTVSFGASHSWSETGVAGSHSDSSRTAVSLSVDIPIYNGGAISLSQQKAERQHQLAEQVLKHTENQTTTATISEFLAVNSQLNQANALREAIVAGENALEAKEEGFKAGLTTNLDVLDAQRDLSRSQKDYLQARYDYILSTLSLERVTGQLDEDDISRINGWLGESAKVSWRPEINPEFVSVIPELGFEFYAFID